MNSSTDGRDPGPFRHTDSGRIEAPAERGVTITELARIFTSAPKKSIIMKYSRPARSDT